MKGDWTAKQNREYLRDVLRRFKLVKCRVCGFVYRRPLKARDGDLCASHRGMHIPSPAAIEFARRYQG